MSLPALQGLPPSTAAIAFLVAGVVLLYFGAEWLVRGAAALGARLGVPAIIVGLTVVSVGTSAPELVVSLLAAFQGSPDLAIGNVLGSNLANVGLILGIGALLRPMAVPRDVLRRDIPWMIGVTLVAFPIMLNLWAGRLEGAVLVGLLLAYFLFLVAPTRRARAERRADRAVREKAEEEAGPEWAADALPGAANPGPPPPTGGIRGILVPIGLVLLGSVVLTAGGRGVVSGATDIAALFGLPELLVGLSIVAVGTSLPELAAVVIAAVRKESDLALGNVVGSNIFNLTLVLGGTAVIHPISIQPRILVVEYPAVLVLSLLLLPLALIRRRVGRIDGVVFLGLYAAAWWWMVG